MNSGGVEDKPPEQVDVLKARRPHPGEIVLIYPEPLAPELVDDPGDVDAVKDDNSVRDQVQAGHLLVERLVLLPFYFAELALEEIGAQPVQRLALVELLADPLAVATSSTTARLCRVLSSRPSSCSALASGCFLPIITRASCEGINNETTIDCPPVTGATEMTHALRPS